MRQRCLPLQCAFDVLVPDVHSDELWVARFMLLHDCCHFLWGGCSNFAGEEESDQIYDIGNRRRNNIGLHSHHTYWYVYFMILHTCAPLFYQSSSCFSPHIAHISGHTSTVSFTFRNIQCLDDYLLDCTLLYLNLSKYYFISIVFTTGDL